MGGTKRLLTDTAKKDHSNKVCLAAKSIQACTGNTAEAIGGSVWSFTMIHTCSINLDKFTGPSFHGAGSIVVPGTCHTVFTFWALKSCYCEMDF